MSKKEYCQICCETFTNKLRNSIKCNNCNNSVCLQCFKKFLLIDGSEQICMCCKIDLNTEFIFMHTPKTFQRLFINKIINLELVREKILLKQTQEKMELQHRRDLLKNREVLLKKHLIKFDDDHEILNLISNTKSELNEVNTEINKKEYNSVTFLCPIPNCEGLIKKGECSCCRNKICKKCQTKKEENHECNKDILENLKLLSKDTKPCPKCLTPIYKIDGCDQMFCIKCKTPFSWKTGNIITGIIHNPHYFEWIRNRGLEPTRTDLGVPQAILDPCGEVFQNAVDNLFLIKLKNYQPQSENEKNIIENHFVQRVTGEISVLLPMLTSSVYDIEVIEGEKRSLRLDYIMKKKILSKKINFYQNKNFLLDSFGENLSDSEENEENYKTSLTNLETNWFQKLRKIYKKREMKKDLIKLLETFDCTIKDLIVLTNETNNYNDMFETIIALVTYFSNQLKENEKRFDLKNYTQICIRDGLSCKLVDW